MQKGIEHKPYTLFIYFSFVFILNLCVEVLIVYISWLYWGFVYFLCFTNLLLYGIFYQHTTVGEKRKKKKKKKERIKKYIYIYLNGIKREIERVLLESVCMYN